MTLIEQAFSYLESFTNLEKTTSAQKREYRLDRMEKLLTDFGNPHQGKTIYHIAGSKGKGSTSFFLAALLTAGGHRTGLYQSPHLVSYTERITLAGKPFADSAYLQVIQEIRDYLDVPRDYPGGPPTTFELLTLGGFLLFHREKCTHLVLETGMGGRLDATNVVDPLCSIITPIELEHTQYLGDTLTQVAGEKAGIIKKSRLCITSATKEEVLGVLRTKARQQKAPLKELHQVYRLESSRITPEGTLGTFLLEGQKYQIQLPSLNRIQLENAALALYTVLQTGEAPDHPEEVLARTALPGRMEVRSLAPLTIIDGSHTPESLKLATEAFQEATAPLSGPCILIFGLSAGKEADTLIPSLGGGFTKIFLTRGGTFRPQPPEEVYQGFQKARVPAEIVQHPEEALKRARTQAGPTGAILITGSFHLAGELYDTTT